MKNKTILLYSLVIFSCSLLSPLLLAAEPGQNYALLIGIDAYKDNGYKPLKTPKNDTEALAAVLKNQYGFKVILLNSNVTKSKIINSFKELSKKIDENDRLLIYYSGYGEIEKLYDYGWWIPADAKKGDIQTYIENTFIKKMLGVLKARHILLITDAAFSKVHFASTPALPQNINQDFYKTSDSKKSRWAISAGTIHPSLKKIIKGHSILAYYLIDALKNNNKAAVSIRELFAQIAPKIKKDSGQQPVCKPIEKTGHLGGEFIMAIAGPHTAAQVKKSPPPKPVVIKTPPPKPELPTTLMVNVNVNDAVLYIDGNKVGISPFKSIEISPGQHILLIKKDGYDPFNGRISVEKSKANVSTIFLNKIKPITGKLFITAEPADTAIRFLNSDLTYKEGMLLNFGHYSIQLSAQGYESQTIETDIEADKESRVNVKLKPLQKFQNSLGMNFQYIAPGNFLMGSPDSEANRGKDEIPHEVILKKQFYMQTTEVTVGQWRQFCTATGYKSEAEAGDGTFIWTGSRWMKSDENSWKNPGFKQNDQHPITCVSWNDAQAFIKWVSKKEKQTYSLPTEAQWEYACRAGSSKIFAFGDCLTTSQANFDGNSIWGNCPRGVSLKGTVEVAKYPPNAWALSDMHGNVWEWCQDWYGAYSKEKNQDPTGPNSGTEKTVRGGAWDSYISTCRAANRSYYKPSESYSNIGFRLVVNIE